MIENNLNQKEIGDRIASTSFSFLIGIFLRLIDRLIILGLLARAVQGEIFADWLVISSFGSYAQSSDLGLGIYYSNLLNEFASKNEQSKYQYLFVKALAMISIIGSLLGIIAVIIIISLPIKELLGLSGLTSTISKFSICTLILAFLINGVAAFLNRVYRSLLSADRAQWILNSRYVIEIILSTVSIIMGWGVIGLALSKLVGASFFMIFNFYDLSRLLNMRLNIFSWKMVREGITDIKDGISLLSVQSTTTWLSSAAIAISSNRYGSAAIVPFTTTLYIANIGLSITKSISSGLWQEFSRIVWHDFSTMKKLINRAIRFAVGTGALGAIALIFLSDTIYRIWLGPSVPDLDKNILVLHGIYVVSESLKFVPFTILMSQNKLKSLLLASIVAAISGGFVLSKINLGSLVIAFVLPISNLVGYGLVWVPFIRLIRSQWNKIGKLLLFSIRPAIIAFVFFLLVTNLNNNYLFILDVVGVLIIGILWFGMVLGHREREAINTLLTGIAHQAGLFFRKTFVRSK